MPEPAVSLKRIVILGGGFGGVYTARALEKLLRPSEAEISLVNQENYFVFQPLLPEVISGSISLLDTVCPIRRLCPRTRLFMRQVDRVDLERKIVTLAPSFRPQALELPYDYLVIATGQATDFSGMPGMAEHAIPFRTLGDALRIRNRVIHAMEEADSELDADFRRRLLTFVVSGGGFSGVEAVAELNDFVRGIARHYPRIPRAEIQCILVHSRERILQEMTPRLAEYAQRILEKRGVTLKLNTRVVAATADSAVLKSGETIATRTLISTVPAGPVPLVQSLECPKEKGRLRANGFLELEGHEGSVWAAGDCASISLANGEAAPPTAQHATREAGRVAENIAAVIRGQAQASFAFAGLGKLGSLGHRSAVAEILGMRISGFAAWLLWRTIYLAKLPGFDRRLRVGLDWLTALLLPAEMVQLRVQTSDSIASEHFQPGEIIFRQGDVGDRMYVIRSGEVEVSRGSQCLAVLGPGDYFGEMALLSNLPRNATVTAIKPTGVLAIAKGDFTKLLATIPQFASEMRQSAAGREEPER